MRENESQKSVAEPEIEKQANYEEGFTRQGKNVSSDKDRFKNVQIETLPS